MHLFQYAVICFISLVWSQKSHSTHSEAAEINRMGRGTPTSFMPSPLSSVNNQARQTLTAVKVSPNGQVYNTQILKQQLANELSLPLRDLRVVDPSFPTQIQATFTARPRAILFCIENIKVVVQGDEALIFSPNRPEVQEFIPHLLQNLLQNTIENNRITSTNTDDENTNTNGGGGIDGDTTFSNNQQQSTSNGQPKLRFEHIVLESALNVVCTSLFNRVRELAPKVTLTLQGLRAETRGLDVVQTQVDQLLPLKNNIDELRKRVKEIKRAITDVLNSDEDMRMMFLSPSPSTLSSASFSSSSPSSSAPSDTTTTATTDTDMDVDTTASLLNGILSTSTNDSSINHPSFGSNKISSSSSSSSLQPNQQQQQQSSQYQQEKLSRDDILIIETLFETYLNEIEWISAELEEFLDEIINTEENVVLQLDILRNRILRFELNLSMLSFVGTCGGFITGMFGMNLVSHLENVYMSFYIVSIVSAIGCTGIFLALRRFAKREKLF